NDLETILKGKQMFEDRKHLEEYIPAILKIKGADIDANINELDDLYKYPQDKLYLRARDFIVNILGEDNKLVKYISYIKHDYKESPDLLSKILESIGYKFRKVIHDAERDIAISGPQKLLTIFKSFRVIDNINVYMNTEGYGYMLGNLKTNIANATLERIKLMEHHILKFHCEGFKRSELKSEIGRKPPISIEDMHYSRQINFDWLKHKQLELGINHDELISIDTINELYENKDLNLPFDVLDKIHLDSAIINYSRAGNLMRRTRDKGDLNKYPFDILEAKYDAAVTGNKEQLMDLRKKHREQYADLQIFKRLMHKYLQDSFKDEKLTQPRIITKEKLKTTKKKYINFGW
ncbi:MAG: hypothetical protein KKF89_01130, partial [Nanoarchaeota archaeon]|nr:hypothetical protein [Nanoarchaeota archaeon]